MLELDETTGLRDYDVTYPSTNGNSDGVTSDPYYGKKIAGGYYVSGEGPYIERVGDYYYLFVSYGNFTAGGTDDKGNAVGGYVMRMFRSSNPDGPYKDANGTSAIFTSYALNFGNGACQTAQTRRVSCHKVTTALLLPRTDAHILFITHASMSDS